MIRKTALYIFLLAIVIGGAPYVAGMLVETNFQDTVKTLSDIDSMPATITVTEYQRGWRRSHAKTRVTFLINNNADPSKQYSILMEHDIRHGPFIQLKPGDYQQWRFARALIHSNLVLTDEAKKILVSELGDSQLFDVNSEITIDGAVKMKIDGKPLKLKEHQGTDRIAWQGMQANWELSRDKQQFKGEVILPGFDFDWEGIHYYAKDLVYKTTMSKIPEGLWVGQFNGNLNQLKIEKPSENFSVTIDATTSGGGMKAEGTIVDFTSTINIEKVKLKEKEYGPINYSNSLKNIDARVVKTFFELNRKIKTEKDVQQSAYAQYFLALVPDLLRSRPEFNIEQMQIHTSQGEISGLLRFAIGGTQANNVNNFQEIIQSIVAKAHLSLPKVILRELVAYQFEKGIQKTNEAAKNTTAVTRQSTPDSTQPLPVILGPQEIAQKVEQQTNDAIGKWLQERMVVEKDPNYIVEIELQQGKFTINGQPVDFKKNTLPTMQKAPMIQAAPPEIPVN